MSTGMEGTFVTGLANDNFHSWLVRVEGDSNDVPGWNGDNSTGLSLAPNGLRYDWAYFDDIGAFGGWWTESQPNPNFVDYLHLESLFGAIQNDPINYGYSIRCIKDAE